eukprot:m.31178 g.31178  ORF g.31178 m.31178 type:complete len:251 (+) comp12042_c0_seq2:184-936(+)
MADASKINKPKGRPRKPVPAEHQSLVDMNSDDFKSWAKHHRKDYSKQAWKRLMVSRRRHKNRGYQQASHDRRVVASNTPAMGDDEAEASVPLSPPPPPMLVEQDTLTQIVDDLVQSSPLPSLASLGFNLQAALDTAPLDLTSFDTDVTRQHDDLVLTDLPSPVLEPAPMLSWQVPANPSYFSANLAQPQQACLSTSLQFEEIDQAPEINILQSNLELPEGFDVGMDVDAMDQDVPDVWHLISELSSDFGV